jgi:tRNA threonylcarbamoyladenosine biosynthesis protein TsaE
MTAPRPSAPAAAVHFETASAEDTQRLAERLAPALEPGDVLSLEGALGAGKTRFVAGLARGFDARVHVRSPTFTLVNEYAGRLPLFHVDLYRVEAGALEPLGLEELRERGVLAVEWGDKLPPHLSADALRVSFSILAPESRGIAFSAGAGRGLELLAACRAQVGSP